MVGYGSHGGELADERLKIGVSGAGFETETVLEGDGESVNEVQGCEFGKEVLLAEFRGFGVSFGDVYPDDASEVAGCEVEVGPVLGSFGVAFVGCGTSKGKSQTDHETHDCKKDGLNAELMDEFGDACYGSSPTTYEQEGKYEFW